MTDMIPMILSATAKTTDVSLGTVFVAVVLLGVILAIILKLRRDKKNGTTCGGCSGCSGANLKEGHNHSSCHCGK